jgi:serine/threonine protein kinase
VPRESLVGRTLAGYTLESEVGEGGTAAVFKARHPTHGVVALKVLREKLRNDRTAVARFLREARFGERVVHPNVVKTIEIGEETGLHFLAIEWAAGELLEKHARRNGPLPPPKVASIVEQVGAGVNAAHEANIVHRDLKPENIMFDERSRTTKLLDFGIARDADQPTEERLTRTGFFVGTLQYVAPEALSGELVDGRADIYSLATIAYYMLTARHPFSGRSPRELFQQLLTRDPAPLRSTVPDRRIPAGLEAVVMRGLARDPARRQPDVAMFAAEFSAACAETAPGGGLLATIRHMIGRST